MNAEELKMVVLEREYMNKAMQSAAANKFTGDYFVLWKVMMTGIFHSSGMWSVVSRDAEAPLDLTDRNIITKLENAKLILLSGLSKEIASQYTSHLDVSTIWSALESVYNANTETTRSEIRKKFQQLKLDEGKTVSEFIETLKYTVSQMEMMNVTVSNEEKIHQLYAGLPADFEPTISILQITNISDFNVIVSRIRDFGVAWERKQQQSIEQVHYTNTGKNKNVNTTNNNRNKGPFPFRCYRCNQQGHRASECNQQIKSNREACIYCKKNNHKSEACYFKPKQDQHLAQLVTEAVQAALCKINISPEQHQAHAAIQQPIQVPHTTTTTQTKAWTAMLDSAASRHLIKDMSLISNMRPLASPVPMVVANNEVVMLNQGGEVVLGTSSTPVVLDVTYAPTFKENLISAGQLTTQNKTKINMDDEKAVVSFGGNGGEIVAYKKGNMYVIEQGKTIKTNKNDNKNYVYTAVNGDVSGNIMHQRIGHISHRKLKQVLKASTGINVGDMDHNLDGLTCQGCALGKSHRHQFVQVNSEHLADNIMDMWVSDLCGPIYGQYISVIIDVKSRIIFIKIIAYKSDAVEHIIQCIRYAQTLTGKTLKRFHSDGGGEYNSNKLKTYLAQQGTIITTTTRSTPQHNGIVERANRTILEMARSMLHHAGMHESYWADAIATAGYLLNRCVPSSLASQQLTRYEAWTGKKPSLQHLRVFGCDVYRHVLKDQRLNKLSATSSIGIFVGYDEEKNGYYKIWDVQEQKLYRTRDVIFIETSFTQAKLKKYPSWSKAKQTSHVTHALNDMFNDNNAIMFDLYTNNPIQQNIAQELVHEPDNIEIKYDDQQDDINTSDIEIMDSDTEHFIEEKKHSDMVPVHVNIPRYPQRHRQAPIDIMPMVRTDLHTERELGLLSAEVYNINEIHVPANYQEAMAGEGKQNWKQAQDDEMESHEQNNTWSYTSLPNGKKAIDCMWVYAVKTDEFGNVIRHKARLVAKGYLQKAGIDYHETFAPVMRYKSLRIILVLTTIKNYHLVQMDVITAFLNADMEEEVYMKQPKGYEQGQDLYCLLNKSLYGTRQASHNWNGVLNEFILSTGFTRLATDTCVYVKLSETKQLIIIGVFVDDMVIAYGNEDEQEWLTVKALFMKQFRMKDMGECKLILGMRITRNRNHRTLIIDNEVYIKKLLKTFRMQQCKHASTPSALAKLIPTTETEIGTVDVKLYQSMVGALNYLVQTCRPDIAHAVNVVCRYASNPSPCHFTAVKRILRYLASTAHTGLQYKGTSQDQTSIMMEGYTDADWGGDTVDRKSTTGYVMKINGCTVSWAVKKQQTVAISTAEAEYMGISAGAQELLWVYQFIGELLNKQVINLIHTPTLYCDNQAAIIISKNDVHHHRTKHIDIKHHFIRDHVKQKKIIIKWIPGIDQVADILTKPLDQNKYIMLKTSLMSVHKNVDSEGVLK